MQEEYILLYGDKKPEDNICITNMFSNNQQINLGWTDFDYNKNMKAIDEIVEKGVKQIIFSGLEIGWDKLIRDVNQKYPELKIKVICNTLDSLLYYDYERQNFFNLLELSKDNIIDDIAFLRKGQYEVYKTLGYKCSFLRENYILEDDKKLKIKVPNDVIDIGIYPLNYTWDKNIFNQLCIPKYIENSNLNYNEIDERMTDFVNTMDIKATSDKIETIDAKHVQENYANTLTGKSNPREISAKFLMLHTLSHLLISQLSFECGYSVASLSERIYCSNKEDNKEMSGIFIYTANGDSEGTLGGLVRQGRPDAFPRIFKKAIFNAQTCSNDPVCIMSRGQGQDSLNLAACHACALLPETCCEERNRFLDRGLIVGTYDNPQIGFWSSLEK